MRICRPSGMYLSWRRYALDFSRLAHSRHFSCLTTSNTQIKTNFFVNINDKRWYSSDNLVTPLFLLAEKYAGKKSAVVDRHGTHSYSQLLSASHTISDKINTSLDVTDGDIKGARICFLCPNDVSYLVTLLGIWMSGGVAVPLCNTHPPSELRYFVEDSASDLVVYTQEFADKMAPLVDKLGVKSLVLDKDDYVPPEGGLPQNKPNHKLRINRLRQLCTSRNQFKQKSALIIYTSGTTGRPKGVVHTYSSLQAMMESMVHEWEWSSSDVVLHVLPLHHIHGIVNVLMTPLYCGATCVMLPKFDATEVWSMLADPVVKSGQPKVNLFMAVPTIYAKLIENFEQRYQTKLAKEYIRAQCSRNIRLMVSGSAALPQPIMDKWETITGHHLLERYGMTEIGMALSNKMTRRVPGAVGTPMLGMSAMLASPNRTSPLGYDEVHSGTKPTTQQKLGDLYIKSQSMFTEYWNKPEATKNEFTSDGWFKTGDTALYSDGVYKIQGRSSVDIIKSGGYKISALDVERHLLSHDAITDVAVVGLRDVTWGQKVAALVVLREGATLDLVGLKSWSKDKMPSYQIPSVLKVVPSMPRNAMGKVNKKELVNNVFEKELKNII